MDNKCDLSCRRNKVGGQAVLEGVMMKAGDRVYADCMGKAIMLFIVGKQPGMYSMEDILA